MRDLNSSLVDPAFNPMPGLSFMNSNTVLDSSSRKVKDDGDESGNSSAGKQVSRRQRYGSFVEPNKRCTNNNCNTTDTPMWRKGPLGPKVINLCSYITASSSFYSVKKWDWLFSFLMILRIFEVSYYCFLVWISDLIKLNNRIKLNLCMFCCNKIFSIFF